MPDPRIRDYSLAIRRADRDRRPRRPLRGDRPPSLANAKEFFAQTQRFARGGNVVANMSRAVIEAVELANASTYWIRTVEFGHFAVSEFTPFICSWRAVDTENLFDEVLPRDPIAERTIRRTYGVDLGGKDVTIARVWHVSSVPEPERLAAATSFIDQARQLDKRGYTDAALDLVYDQIDEMLLAGRFDEVDRLLETIAPADFSAVLLLAFLTATLPAKKQLQRRSDFLQRVEQTLRERGELTGGLLVGLD